MPVPSTWQLQDFATYMPLKADAQKAWDWAILESRVDKLDFFEDTSSGC
jgi:hypothetical protein